MVTSGYFRVLKLGYFRVFSGIFGYLWVLLGIFGNFGYDRIDVVSILYRNCINTFCAAFWGEELFCLSFPEARDCCPLGLASFKAFNLKKFLIFQFQISRPAFTAFMDMVDVASRTS